MGVRLAAGCYAPAVWQVCFARFRLDLLVNINTHRHKRQLFRLSGSERIEAGSLLKN